jgi:hypothetical protein
VAILVSKQTLRLVQSSFAYVDWMKANYGEISTEKCMAFCPYRADGWLPGADKALPIAANFFSYEWQ